MIEKELTAGESMVIRQTISEVAGTMLKDRLEHIVREQVDAGIRQQLPEIVREHLGSIDLVVKDEIRQATLKASAFACG